MTIRMVIILLKIVYRVCFFRNSYLFWTRIAFYVTEYGGVLRVRIWACHMTLGSFVWLPVMLQGPRTNVMVWDQKNWTLSCCVRSIAVHPHAWSWMRRNRISFFRRRGVTEWQLYLERPSSSWVKSVETPLCRLARRFFWARDEQVEIGMRDKLRLSWHVDWPCSYTDLSFPNCGVTVVHLPGCQVPELVTAIDGTSIAEARDFFQRSRAEMEERISMLNF